MGVYYFYDILDMSASNTGIIKDGPDAAGFSTYRNQTFSWNPNTSTTAASTTISIVDNDGALDSGPDSTGQDLNASLLGDNTTWASGTSIFASYSYQFRAPDGSTQYIYAIQQDGNNNVIGYVSTYALTSGTSYSITQANNSPTANYAGLASPPPPDGIVEGTAGGDVINATYTGDPEGDKIDNSDNTGAGVTAGGVAGSNDDLVQGFGGNDTITSGDGNDTVYAGTGDDNINGGVGNDVLYGYGDTLGASAAELGNDTISGGDGNDSIYGGAGNDVLNGDAGNDLISGGADNDNISGGTGNDTLYGEGGNDLVMGGTGSDVVDGGDGNDLVIGGSYNTNGTATNTYVDDNIGDTLTGGLGNDTFMAGNGDTITDFNTGNTGPIDDLNQTNNDFVDLSGYYNEANLAIWNANHPGQQYNNPLAWMRADQADDGVLNGISTANGFSSDFTSTIHSGGSATDPTQLTWDNTNVTCFSASSVIETDRGPVAAGSLKIGDLVLTRDGGLQPIRWIGRRDFGATDFADAPGLRPIRIAKGVLGAGLPTADLLLSPQHRVLVRSRIAQKMFGTDEVLVAAKQLCLLPGINVAEDVDQITYVHFMFDAHQIIWSNGAETESLFTGPEALKSVGPAAREEIFAIFPELRTGGEHHAVRPLASGRMARKLAVRHAQNGRPLVV